MNRPHESPECRCDGCATFDVPHTIGCLCAKCQDGMKAMFGRLNEAAARAYRETPSAHASPQPPQESPPAVPDALPAVQAGDGAPAGRIGAP